MTADRLVTRRIAFRTIDGLTLLLQSRGEFERAEVLLAQAVEASRALPQDSALHVRQYQEKLRDLYRAWHALEPEAGHDARAEKVEQE